MSNRNTAQLNDESDEDPQELIEDGDEGEAEDADGALKDRFGFFLDGKGRKALSLISEEERARRKGKEGERALKWVRMVRGWSRFADPLHHSRSDAKLKRRVRKGVPDAVRGFVWFHLAQGEAVKTRYPDVRLIEISSVPALVRDEIERDVDRTFPRHVLFVEAGGQGQASLRRLLTWYAALDPEVGYCQGMGFLAGLFLTYMIEEHAFYTFYSILTREACPLRTLYLPKLVDTQKILFVFEQLGKLHLGDLWNHLETEGIHPTMYFTEWAMTLFCRGFSFELVTRVFDIFLLEANYKIVYRVSLAILKYFEKELTARRFDKIMAFLREIPNRIDAVKVMDICWTIPLRRAEVAFYEKQYHDRVHG